MSCYRLETTNADQLTCRVGWDSGVASYFVYIARPLTKEGRTVPDAGHVIKWRGMVDEDLPTIELLEREIEGFAYMTSEIRDALIRDEQRTKDRTEEFTAQGIG